MNFTSFPFASVLDLGLDKKKEAETQKQKVQLLLHSIRVLFNQIEEIVNAINSDLETAKIKMQTSISNPPGRFSASLELRFFSKTLICRMFDFLDIEKYEKTTKDNDIEYQKQKHRMSMRPPHDTTLKKEKVVLAGYIVVNPTTQPPQGFNIILRKSSDEDLYGEWWAASFSDHAFYSKSHHIENFAFTDSNKFLQEYDLTRQAMHIYTVNVKELQDDDLEKILRILLS